LGTAIRLRQASSDYFAESAASVRLDWPDRPLRLCAIYRLAGDCNQSTPATVTRLTLTESYPLLLEQAFSMTLALPELNQRLMTDYLALVTAVPVYRLAYRKAFDAFDELVDTVEHHVRRELTSMPTDAASRGTDNGR